MPTSILEQRRRQTADELAGVVREAEQLMARDDFNPDDSDYQALREQRTTVEARLADVNATIAARALAETPAHATVAGEQITDFRRVLREYDRGNSDRVQIPYDIHREVTTGDVFPQTARITVTVNPPVYTPSLDLVRGVQTTQNYDFIVPPPPVQAGGPIAEGAQKPAAAFAPVRVAGSLETDAHILDVSRQTLEDDAAAERTLRAWLVDGVRLKQDAKVAAAIAGATGTLTATGSGIAGALRAGKSALAAIGIRATAAYLNPSDAEDLDLADFAAGGGTAGVPTVWGMVIVENPAIGAGTPIVGDLRNAVYFLYRNAISTYLTDAGMTVEGTPRDRFSHNILGILAEGRSKAHVVAPGLLVKCTVGATTAAAASAPAPSKKS